MKKWEYCIKQFKGCVFISDLNKMGDSGWELMSEERSPGGYECRFKREIPSKLLLEDTKSSPCGPNCSCRGI